LSVDNAPESAADRASAHPHQAQQLAKPESNEVSQSRSSKAGHLLPNVVGRQHDGQAMRQMLAKVEQGRFRRRVATEHLSVSGSARRHRWAPLNRANLAEVRLPDYISLRLGQGKRMKHEPNERECRGLVVNRLRHNSNSSHSSGSKVPRLPQPIAASRKAETRGNQKERHRHGRNNFSVTNTSGSGM